MEELWRPEKQAGNHKIITLCEIGGKLARASEEEWLYFLLSVIVFKESLPSGFRVCFSVESKKTEKALKGVYIANSENQG